MTIIVTKIEDEILVSSPYHPALPKAARAIGGSWDASKKVWIFKISDEHLVKALYLDVYNEWENAETVRVRITTHSSMRNVNDSVYICGKQIARATGRDSGARTGEDVRWVSGELPSSGGSAKYWTTFVGADSVFEIVNFPSNALDKLSELAIESNFEYAVVEEELNKSVDVTLLIAEREHLMARIAEIDRLLE